MLAKSIFVAALASAASAQQMNLTATLASLPQLSNLTSYISAFPALLQQLSGAQNVTLLAPNNAAFAKALSGSAGQAFSANDTAMIEGLFLYHVLNGTYYASAVTSNASFLPTALTSASQQTLLNPAVVEAITVGGQVKFVSGLLTESTVTSPVSSQDAVAPVSSLTLIESQFHWWYHPHNRYPPDPPPKHRRHCHCSE